MVGAQAMSDQLRDKTPLSAEPQSCDMEHAQQWFADQGKPSLKLDYPPLVSLAAEFTKARSEVLGAAPPVEPSAALWVLQWRAKEHVLESAKEWSYVHTSATSPAAIC